MNAPRLHVVASLADEIPAQVAEPTDSQVTVARSDREVIELHYARWRRFAAVVGSLDVEPDDLVQEALARALARGSLVDLDHPGAYICRAITNLASNRRRSLRRRDRAVSKLNVDQTHTPHYPSDLADLEALRPLERAVLFLADVEGRSFGEISQLLGGSEVSHRLRASRARRKLADLLSDEEEGR